MNNTKTELSAESKANIAAAHQMHLRLMKQHQSPDQVVTDGDYSGGAFNI